ncbi:MAG: class I SAM-dependent methyltransferase [Candidatus Moraniibacteriota bacterium]
MIKNNWWEEDYGFFGEFYMQGDDSVEGYHESRKLTLKQRTNEEVNGIINLCSLKKKDVILDCPCGYGRHSIGLARRGYLVVGSDINSYELLIAKKEAERQRVKAEFKKENMLNLKYKNKFNAIINMWYSFGFFELERDNIKVLKNFYDALKDGGVFLMHTDVNLPKMHNGKFREYEKRRLKGRGILRQVEFYNKKTKRNNGVWIIEDNNGSIRMKDYSVRVYSKNEFISLCKKVGFRSVNVYSDWSGKKYDEESDDMIIIVKK